MAIETEAKFSVGGVLFDQPFKIRRLGHLGLNAYRMSDALRFYNDCSVSASPTFAPWAAKRRSRSRNLAI